jgi:uncharacterized membrane protein HdeD (DUF308 family)
MKQSVKSDSRILVFLLPIVYVVLGVILLIYRTDAMNAICILLAAFVAAAGILRIALYLLRTPDRNFSSNGFCIGLLELIFGVIALIKNSLLLQYIPVVLGCLIVYNGTRELQNALDVLRLKMGNALAILIIALVNIALGVVLVLVKWSAAAESTRLIITGVGLILSGAIDFVVSLLVWLRLRKNRKAAEAAAEQGAAAPDADAAAVAAPFEAAVPDEPLPPAEP